MLTFVAGFMLAALGLMLCNITSAHSETIKLEQEGGVYKLPVRINDAVTLPFIVDSGAAEVSIPAMYFWFCFAGRQSAKLMTLGAANSHRQMARPSQASAFSCTRWALATMSLPTLLQTSFP